MRFSTKKLALLTLCLFIFKAQFATKPMASGPEGMTPTKNLKELKELSKLPTFTFDPSQGKGKVTYNDAWYVSTPNTITVRFTAQTTSDIYVQFAPSKDAALTDCVLLNIGGDGNTKTWLQNGVLSGGTGANTYTVVSSKLPIVDNYMHIQDPIATGPNSYWIQIEGSTLTYGKAGKGMIAMWSLPASIKNLKYVGFGGLGTKVTYADISITNKEKKSFTFDPIMKLAQFSGISGAYYNATRWIFSTPDNGTLKFKARPLGDDGFLIQFRSAADMPFVSMTNLGWYYNLIINSTGATLQTYYADVPKSGPTNWNRMVTAGTTDILKTRTLTEQDWWIDVVGADITVGKGKNAGQGPQHKFTVPTGYIISDIQYFALGGISSKVNYTDIEFVAKISPKIPVRCAILMDDYGDESIKGSCAIALDLIWAMRDSVECILVSHSILQNLLDRHDAGSDKRFKAMPDIMNWLVYDVNGTQFYLLLSEKSFDSGKYSINVNVPLGDGAKVTTEFPLFKFPNSKIKWNVDQKTLEEPITSKLEKIDFGNLKYFYLRIKHNSEIKTKTKFDISNLAEIFVTPEFVIDIIKDEKESLEKIYKNFIGENVGASRLKNPKMEEAQKEQKNPGFKIQEAKTGIARLNLLNYLRRELPQYNFFVSGHGGYLQSMVGIPLPEIPKLLIFINKLNTKVVAISSCFAGGVNLSNVVENLKKTIKDWDKINYILAVLSTGDSLTYRFAEFSNFFSQIESGKSDKKSVQSWLGKALKAVSIGHLWEMYITNVPQIMVPGVGWVSLIDVSEEIQIINPVTLQKDEKEIEIKNKISVLLYVDVVSKPLVINPTEVKDMIGNNLIKLFALSKTNYESGLDDSKFLYPVFLSAIKEKYPEYAFRYIKVNKGIIGGKDANLMGGDMGVLRFIRDAFLIAEPDRISTKTFYIETLEGYNDFKNLFLDHGDASLNAALLKNEDLRKYLGETSPDDLILKNVFIITSNSVVELLFTLPVKDAQSAHFRIYVHKDANKMQAYVIENEEIENAWKFDLITEEERNQYFDTYDINLDIFPYFKSKIVSIVEEELRFELKKIPLDWTKIKKVVERASCKSLTKKTF